MLGFLFFLFCDLWIIYEEFIFIFIFSFKICGDLIKEKWLHWELLSMFEASKIYTIMVRLHFDDMWFTMNFLMIFEMI